MDTDSHRSDFACKQCCACKFCFLSGLDPAILDRLSPFMRRQRLLHKGDRLYRLGDPFQRLYIIKSGSFKTSYYDTSGNQQIISFHFSADLLGGDGIPCGQHRYEVEALETATVCPLPYPRDNILNQGQAFSLLEQITAAISGQAFEESRWFLALARLKADQRLARFLLALSDQMATCGRCAWEFPLAMPRHDIANHLGIANETVSRLFKRFEHDAWIRARRRWVQLLDREALLELADCEPMTVQANVSPAYPVKSDTTPATGSETLSLHHKATGTSRPSSANLVSSSGIAFQ